MMFTGSNLFVLLNFINVLQNEKELIIFVTKLFVFIIKPT